MTLTPTHGARFELFLIEGAPTPRYRVEARTSDAAFLATADLERAGVQLVWSAPPPNWIADTTLALLKVLLKNHLEDGRWPKRLHRWRESR